MSKDVKVRLNVSALNTWLLIGLLVILLVSTYALVQVQRQLGAGPAAPHVAALTLTIVQAPQCDDCFNPDAFSVVVKQTPLTNVTEVFVAHDSIEGQKLIKDYQLTRLPAAVVTGEIGNVTVQGFTKAGDAYVFTMTPAPYYDIALGGVAGRVALTYITDKACKECFDITQFSGQLKQAGIVLSSERALDASDKEAQQLIRQYSITKVPTMLLGKDALAYETIGQVWGAVGSQEADGTLVFRNVTPPYKDLGTRKIRGLVTLTLLGDKTCDACYNVSMHRLVLEQSFGMKFKDVKAVDVNGPLGKELTQKYGITFVPTFLLDSEAEAYAALPLAWPQVGTRHGDGTFVFQKVDMLEGVTYKDLGTNQVKNATRAA